MERKQETPKTCERCGKPMTRKRYKGTLESNLAFSHRKYCGLRCANARTEIGRQGWLWRARKHRESQCAACGTTTELHVHHADKDITNLTPENLQTLCTRCHRFLHATAKRLGMTAPGKLASPVLR